MLKRKNNLLHKVFLIYIFTSICYAQENNLDINEYQEAINQKLTPGRPDCITEEKVVNNKELSVRDQLKLNFLKLGGDPIALVQAFCFYDKFNNTNFKATGDPSRVNGIKIDNKRYITINDLNLSSIDKRLFVLDLETGKVFSYLSAHGDGGRKGVKESDLFLEQSSNINGSFATPRGFFVTGKRKNISSDPRWDFSMFLHGLQKDVNDLSFVRHIIFHPFPGVPDDFSSSDDEYPIRRSYNGYTLSHGCTMIAPKHADVLIDNIKAKNDSEGGSLYYNYTNIEKERGELYCGEENLELANPLKMSYLKTKKVRNQIVRKKIKARSKNNS